MRAWRNFVQLFILLLSLLVFAHVGCAEDVSTEDLARMLPAGDGTLDAPIDFTNADDVMEKLGPVVSFNIFLYTY
jgi:hypothetical protein